MFIMKGLIIIIMAVVASTGVGEWMDRLLSQEEATKRQALFEVRGLEHALKRELVDALLDVLRGEDEKKWCEAADALVVIGHEAEKAIPALIQGLQSPCRTIVLHAMRTLVPFGPKAHDALPRLMLLINHQDMNIALRACETMGCLVSPDHPALKGRRDEMKEFWKDAHGNFVGWFLDQNPGVIQTLQPPPENEREPIQPETRDWKNRFKKALPGLMVVVFEDHRLVRAEAVEALGEIGPDAKPAVPVLIDVLDDGNSTVRGRAMRALRRVGPEAVPDLIQGLRDRRVDVVLGLVEVLGEHGQAARGAVRDLMGIAWHQDLRVRERVIWALGEIGPDARDAIPLLKQLMNDSHREIKQEAESAIKKIQGR